MKKVQSFIVFVISTLTILISCNKDGLVDKPRPGNPGGNPGPGNPDSGYLVKVKATITIGDILYDSIPAELQITSWDSNNISHQKNLSLTPGTNNIALIKAHKKYKLTLTKWGVTDEITFNKGEIPEGTVIGLGATATPKKIKVEESYLLVEGAYRPDSKIIYSYGANGLLSQYEFFQKKPQHSDLKLYHKDVYTYSGTKVDEILRFDSSGQNIGRTEFTYNASGKITNMLQASNSGQTGAAVEYSASNGYNNIQIDYLYSNGNALEYKMKFKGGNLVQDAGLSSRGGGETGTYSYDFNINPYAHMNMPNIYLSNLSKNNLIGQSKSYSGSIPSRVPYKFEYTYDDNGYPVQLLTSYTSYTTGEHLYLMKTIYRY